MSITKIISNIFGKFWLYGFKDLWLIQNILNLFSYILNKRFQVLHTNLHNQVSAQAGTLLKDPVCLKVITGNIKDKKPANIALLKLSLSSETTTRIDSYDSDSVFVLPIYKLSALLTALNTRIKQDTKENIKLDTLSFDIQDNKLLFNNKALNPKSCYIELSLSILYCSVFWGLPIKYIDLQDRFTTTYNIPKDWIVKYPLAVRSVLTCNLFGASLYLALHIFGILTQCPVATVNGKVTDIKLNIVYINDIPHKGWSALAVAVFLGQNIKKGEALFLGSLEDTIPTPYVITNTINRNRLSLLDYLDIPTKAGILQALDKSLSVSNNILPLKAHNTLTLLRYKNMCMQSLYTTKYTLPAKVNTINWIIDNCWSNRFAAFILPSRNLNQLLTALLVIKRNTRKDAVIYAYTKNIYVTPETLQNTLQVIYYFLNSINNEYVIKVNCYDL